MALSCDSVDDHNGWIADIAAASGASVNFPIISDANREIAVLLGMLDDDEKDSAGIPATVRKLFIVGPDRKIKLVITYPTAVGRSFPEILRVIDALQLTAKFPIATPVNWERGGDVMIQPTVSDADARVRQPRFLERNEKALTRLPFISQMKFPSHTTTPLPSCKGYLRATTEPR